MAQLRSDTVIARTDGSGVRNLNTYLDKVDAATSTATPNTIVQRDAQGRIKAAAPSAADDVARKAEVDAKVSKSGDTMTGPLTIQTEQPRTTYRTTNDSLNALIGPQYQNSAGENRWITGYNPTSGIYGVYDYVRASLRFSIAADGPFTFDGRTLAVGSGSPEGVVTAPPGSLYLNTAGGSGTTFYVKRTGTGNTGWFAVA